jgi:hypothetical protein
VSFEFDRPNGGVDTTLTAHGIDLSTPSVCVESHSVAAILGTWTVRLTLDGQITSTGQVRDGLFAGSATFTITASPKPHATARPTPEPTTRPMIKPTAKPSVKPTAKPSATRPAPTHAKAARPVSRGPAHKVVHRTPKTAFNPSVFALPLSIFPPGSTALKKKIEPNDTLKKDVAIPHLGNNSFVKEGRTTGYYMSALQANDGQPVLIQYLVSLFGTPTQAKGAFNDQLSEYKNVARFYPDRMKAIKAPVHVGENQASYVGVSDTGSGISDGIELFFTRGHAYVEVFIVFKSDDLDPFGRDAFPYFYSVSKHLDAIALRVA